MLQCLQVGAQAELGTALTRRSVAACGAELPTLSPACGSAAQPGAVALAEDVGRGSRLPAVPLQWHQLFSLLTLRAKLSGHSGALAGGSAAHQPRLDTCRQTPPAAAVRCSWVGGSRGWKEQGPLPTAATSLPLDLPLLSSGPQGSTAAVSLPQMQARVQRVPTPTARKRRCRAFPWAEWPGHREWAQLTLAPEALGSWWEHMRAVLGRCVCQAVED